MSVIDLFTMSSLPPKRTGLPFVAWISSGGDACLDVRVRVSPAAKAVPDEMVSVAICPDVHVVEGSMDPAEFELLKTWVELNRQTLMSHWEGEIDTRDALESLVRLR